MSDAVIDQPGAPAPASPPAQPPAAPSPAPSPPAAAPAAPVAPSLLAKGATGAAITPAPTADGAPASPIPAKYQVKKDDGSIDVDASMAKWSEGHSHLEKRLGGGDAPPSKPEDYAPTLPEGLSIDALKADPLYQGFLKGAHARGMSNADVSFVLEAYQSRLAMASSPEAGEAALRKEWQTDDQMQRGLADAYRAAQAFTGGDTERSARIEAKFGSDPDFVWLMAQVGKELAEDTSVHGALSSSEQQTMESLMASAPYHDAKHPEHAVTVARAKAMYAKRYGAE